MISLFMCCITSFLFVYIFSFVSFRSCYFDPEDVETACKECLARLRTDYIDLFLVSVCHLFGYQSYTGINSFVKLIVFVPCIELIMHHIHNYIHNTL